MSFELHPATSTVLIGSPVTIEGTARFPQDFQLSLKADGQKTDPFTIANVQLDPPKIEGGMKSQQIHLQVIPFDMGRQTFPPLEWTLTDSSGETTSRSSPPVKIQVTGPDTHLSDLHDIVGPLRPPLWMFLVVVFLAAAALGLVGYEAWIFLKSKKTLQAGEAVVRKPPYEEALDALATLRESGLGARETYDRLSEVLRVYIERRFEIPALVLTTSDLLRMMRHAEIDRPAVGLAKDLFARCDLVKFAKLIPDGPEIRQDIEAAIEIVKITAPKPPPVPEPTLPARSSK